MNRRRCNVVGVHYFRLGDGMLVKKPLRQTGNLGKTPIHFGYAPNRLKTKPGLFRLTTCRLAQNVFGHKRSHEADSFSHHSKVKACRIAITAIDVLFPVR